MTRGRMLLAMALLAVMTAGQGSPFENPVFTPHRIGLALGTPAAAVLEAMQHQGFTFVTPEEAAGFDFETSEKVAVVQVQGFELADSVIRVTANMGSAKRWSSNDVVLGIRGGVLAFVHEAAVLKASDARQAYEELAAALGSIYAAEPRLRFPEVLVADFALLTLGRNAGGLSAIPVAPRESLHSEAQFWATGRVATVAYLLPVFASPTRRYLGVTSFDRCAYPRLAPDESACD